ncbi:hypothetical protein GX51_02414 [Blastomyces parvus]|uniref:Uncharacterized protein n=1 Tax=Blastomyces parvus TaxID=2060905 RepID=A0A2B7XCE3_9EURO|nr:hypothetical protein GX51_02414 [Blastomyces parvus]
MAVAYAKELLSNYPSAGIRNKWDVGRSDDGRFEPSQTRGTISSS